MSYVHAASVYTIQNKNILKYVSMPGNYVPHLCSIYLLCSPLPMVPSTYIPPTTVPMYLCLLGTYVPPTYVTQYQCSLIPMFLGTHIQLTNMFPSSYVH